MRKHFIIFLFLLAGLPTFGQLHESNRFMLMGKDTLPYAMENVLCITKFGDTILRQVDSYPSFYLVDGKVFNLIDEECSKQGDWIENNYSSIETGRYVNGSKHGLWKEVYKKVENSSFALWEYNHGNLLWGKSFYADSSIFSSIDFEVSEENCCHRIEKEWFRNGQMSRFAKYKIPINKNNDVPIQKYETDTSYEWFPSGKLRYIGINDSIRKSYRYYFENGNIEVDVVFGQIGAGSRVVKRYYANGNLEFVKYFQATPQNYNTEVGTWSFYDEKGVLTRQLFYDNGLLLKTETLSYDAFVKVHFLYGSKRRMGYKNSESKWFGGKRGGHVGIEIDSNRVLNFLPDGPFHWIAKDENFSSKYEIHNLEDFWGICGGTRGEVKKATIVIPISKKQKQKLDSLTTVYMSNSPYDYAFLGFRCASAAYEILAQIGVTEKYSHRRIYMRFFYPKILRKRLFKKA